MDKQLVQITDLVKDYAKIIDELREKNELLKKSNQTFLIVIDEKNKTITELFEDINSLKNQNKKLEETVKINVRLLGEKESQIAELKKNDLIRSESIKNYCEEILELRRRHENQVETIKILQDRNRDLSKLNIHEDSSFWKQREELKEENKVLRQALSDIAANLGNGSTVSVEASLPFIKELPHEVKLVCDEA